MRLTALINKLNKARDKYVKDNKVEPIIWDIVEEDYDEMVIGICAGKKKEGFVTESLGEILEIRFKK